MFFPSTGEKGGALHSPDYVNRPVTGGGVVCTCWDIRSVNFFCFLKTSIRDGGASDSVA